MTGYFLSGRFVTGAIMFIVLLPLSLFCEDITTKNGKVYKDVQIFKQEADRLIVTYPRGAATIYLEDCTEDIQKKYNYYKPIADNDRSQKAVRENNPATASFPWKPVGNSLLSGSERTPQALARSNTNDPVHVAATDANLHGDDVKLEWIRDGLSAKLGYYRPIRVDLSSVKPARVARMPENVSNPLFGMIAMGPKESPTEAIVLLDEPDKGPARLWLDSNGNGDLTDDPSVKWVDRLGKKKNATTTSWSGSAALSVVYGQEHRLLGINLYRFDKNDPERRQLKNALFYYRDFGYLGNMSIAGKSFQAALVDDSARGDFRPSSDVALLIDLNANGRFERQGESFDARNPFNIAGTTYEIGGLTAQGNIFQLRASSQAVAETPVLPALEIGGKPVAFEEKSTTGQTIRFPADYKGKLVMLDFWATWCGPCRGELPNLVKVYEKLHPKGFEVLGVSLDSEESMRKLSQFTDENHMPWPQICDGNGWSAKIARQYGVQGIPACWLIDGNAGLIVAGQADLRGAALRPTIERCLAKLGKPPAIDPAADAGKVGKAPAEMPASEDPLIPKARELAKVGKFLSVAGFNTLRNSPESAAIKLPPASTQPLRVREIAARASQAYLRAGWIYHCAKCDRYHVKLAGGYAIAKDTVVTAFHVMESPDTIEHGEGYPVVVRGNDEIVPIVSVLAANETLDAIILRVAAGDLHPLAINTGVSVGDTVYCFSDPHDAHGYFSNGIINRFYSKSGGSPDNFTDQRFNVSTDWGFGSSGAALLDECANVVGHVARIQPISGKKPSMDSEVHHDDAAPTIMTLHEAVPAAGILKLIENVKAGAAGVR